MGARPNGRKEGIEGRKVVFSILGHILDVSDQRVGIPTLGKSHGRVKERERGQESKISL